MKQQTVFIAHNGCVHLGYDINLVKEGFRRKGYEVTEDAGQADEIVFAGCGVRSFFVKDALKKTKRLAAGKKRVVFTGCASQIEKQQAEAELGTSVSVMSLRELLESRGIGSLEAIDESFSQDERFDFVNQNPIHSLTPEKKRVLEELKKIDAQFGTSLVFEYQKSTEAILFYNEQSPVEYVTVSRGCPYSCSYCAIPVGRGKYSSVSPDVVLRKIDLAVKKGKQKVLLLGDEVGNYGIGLEGWDLSRLLDAIFKQSPHVRLGLRFIEPAPFLKHFNTIQKYCKQGRIFALYVPVQSGSPRILKLMNRHYDLEEVKEKIILLKKTGVIILQNFIVGFPSETQEDFEATVQYVKELGDGVHIIIPFSSRPGTPAHAMKSKTPNKTKLERLLSLNKMLLDLKLAKFEKLLSFLSVKRKSLILATMACAENDCSNAKDDFLD